MLKEYPNGDGAELAEKLGDSKHNLLKPYLAARRDGLNFLFGNPQNIVHDYLMLLKYINMAADSGFYTLSGLIADGLENAIKLLRENEHILILGETGVGKERFVETVKDQLKIKNKVTINCATIQENLAESLLFGSVKGAFTGATDRKGLIEEAGDGLIFFDEIQSLPKEVYSKMLRFLENGEYERVGAVIPQFSKAKLIFASNVNLDDSLVRRNCNLPDDFYFRIRSMEPIRIPPLRERKADILFIVYNKFKELYEEKPPEHVASEITYGKGIDPNDPVIRKALSNPLHFAPPISPSFLQALIYDQWAGNARDLISTIKTSWYYEKNNSHIEGTKYFYARDVDIYNDVLMPLGLESARNLFSLEDLEKLGVEEILRKKYLPNDVIRKLSGNDIDKSVRDLKYFAQKRIKINDLIALYCYEVEQNGMVGELKTERPITVGIKSFSTYKKHLDRGKNIYEDWFSD